MNPADREGRNGQVLRPAVVLGRRVGEHTVRDVGVLYVATPELLGHLGLDPATVGPDADVLTAAHRRAALRQPVRPSEAARTAKEARRASRRSTSPPTPPPPPRCSPATACAGTGGSPHRPAGWSRRAPRPPAPRLAQARQVAADAGMTIETRDHQTQLTAIRSGATAAGMLLALGILAMTVGLIRSEAAGDLRTLTATGATGTTRRTLTAATGGALALLGVLLGAAGAYLALLAGYHDDLGPSAGSRSRTSPSPSSASP